MTLNHVREKGKPQWKLLYKLFGQQDVYDPLLDVSKFPTLVHLTEFLVGIQHFVGYQQEILSLRT